MCAVGGRSNLNNLNATEQPPPGVECSKQRAHSIPPLPISSETTFLSLTYHKNASERLIVVLAGSQFEFRQNTTYSEPVFSCFPQSLRPYFDFFRTEIVTLWSVNPEQ
jgi:hypothetical protein